MRRARWRAGNCVLVHKRHTLFEGCFSACDVFYYLINKGSAVSNCRTLESILKLPSIFCTVIALQLCFPQPDLSPGTFCVPLESFFPSYINSHRPGLLQGLLFSFHHLLATPPGLPEADGLSAHFTPLPSGRSPSSPQARATAFSTYGHNDALTHGHKSHPLPRVAITLGSFHTDVQDPTGLAPALLDLLV